jgi:uncharacterized DUF497 family protein
LEWDPRKAADNLLKHGADFADAVGVFEDPLAITVFEDSPAEQRWVAIGRDFLDRTVVVVYAWRGETIRIISARRATSRERRACEG